MSHTYSNNIYHIIFAAKDRMGIIPEQCVPGLRARLAEIASEEECVVFEANAVKDHAHVLIGIPPSKRVSDIVCKLKANSSRWIKENNTLPYGFKWQTGYSCFSVSASQRGQVAKYIQNQAEHHSGTTFTEEIRAFLAKNGLMLVE